MHPKLTPRERGLVKGALRRIFARSELRMQVMKAASLPNHVDTSRPRVKFWCKCTMCGKPEARSNMVVDHILPVIPLHSSLEQMSLDELIDRMWCDIENLQVLCERCHLVKTKEESAIRRDAKRTKKGLKNVGKRKTVKKSVKTNSKRATNKRTSSRRTS